MKTFTIKKYDEGGIRKGKEQKQNVRLVCITDNNNEKIAIWGTDTSQYKNMNNIDKVLNAVKTNGFPCKIKCCVKNPADWAVKNFSHKYWVEEEAQLDVV